MKKAWVIAGLALVLSATAYAHCGMCGMDDAKNSSYPGPHEAAPNIYTKLFENDRVRVSEIKFAPGDKAPMHHHSFDHFVTVIEGGELTLTAPDGTSKVATAKAGDVIWMSPEDHEAVNTGTTIFRATVSELK